VKVSTRWVKIARGRTDWVQLTVVIFYGPTDICPNKTCPSVIERSAGQRNMCVLNVVIERGRGP